MLEENIQQRIPDCSCVRKEIVDKDILVTFGNVDSEIMLTLRITNGPPKRKSKWNQFNQFR